MRIYILLVVAFTSLSCSTLFHRTPASSEVSHKPRHVIITVHGLSGDETTWGSFNEVTQHYLPIMRPDSDVVISNFIYPTGHSEKLSTMDFANLLNQHIEGLFKDHPIEADDRISLVGHSQGGIVSYIWFFSRILDDKLEQKYIQHVDSIITLGTPFWGSKLASMLTDKNIPDIVPLIRLFADGLVTHRELVDMSFGSDMIHKFRQLAIKMDTDPALEKKIQALPVRLVNIMGILPTNSKDVYISSDQNIVSKTTKRIVSEIYKLFKDKSNNTSQIESDVAVMVPSGRWDFIYAPTQIIADRENKVSASQFTHFNHFTDRDRSKFFFTESVHLPFDTDSTLSMAYISKSCLIPEQCTHPTYRYVLEQLANCEFSAKCNTAYADELNAKFKIHRSHVDKDGKPITDYEAFKNISKNLQTFTIQMEIKLKPGKISQFPVKFFTKSTSEDFDVWTLNESSLIGKVIDLKRDGQSISKLASTDNMTVFIAPKTERRSIDIVSREAKTVTENDIIRVNLVGYVKYKETPATTAVKTIVPLSINLPGQPAVDIEAVVQPGYSTYLPLDYTKLQ